MIYFYIFYEFFMYSFFVHIYIEIKFFIFKYNEAFFFNQFFFLFLHYILFWFYSLVIFAFYKWKVFLKLLKIVRRKFSLSFFLSFFFNSILSFFFISFLLVSSNLSFLVPFFSAYFLILKPLYIYKTFIFFWHLCNFLPLFEFNHHKLINCPISITI